MIEIIVLIVGAVVAVAACINIVLSIFTGGPDDVDTRGPRRRFPK